MKSIFIIVILFLSGLFIRHPTQIKTAIIPTPTPINCEQVRKDYAGKTLTADQITNQIFSGYYNCFLTPTPSISIDNPPYNTPTPIYFQPTEFPTSDLEYIYPNPTPSYYEQPTPTPITHISCYQSGNMTYCDNGVSYTTQYNTGNNNSYDTLGSDGSYTNTNGNYTYGENGSSIRSGNFSYGSDGTTCERIGNIINCNK